jgi:hypothetical protein
MSLLSYEEARPWAGSIKREVEGRAMPPWHADPQYGRFSNDRRLTEEEIQSIVAWVDSGAPRGNPEDMPELPSFVEGWQLSYLLGPPDAVFPMEEEFVIPASGPDLNPNIEFPMPLTRTDGSLPRKCVGTRAWSITTSFRLRPRWEAGSDQPARRAWSQGKQYDLLPRAREVRRKELFWVRSPLSPLWKRGARSLERRSVVREKAPPMAGLHRGRG